MYISDMFLSWRDEQSIVEQILYWKTTLEKIGNILLLFE